MSLLSLRLRDRDSIITCQHLSREFRQRKKNEQKNFFSLLDYIDLEK